MNYSDIARRECVMNHSSNAIKIDRCGGGSVLTSRNARRKMLILRASSIWLPTGCHNEHQPSLCRIVSGPRP